MKYLLFVSLILVFACSQKEEKQAAEAEDDVEWKEMDEFHAVMADVYHPLKDSSNLEPIKKDADDLSAAATKWAKAKVPSKVDNDQTKEALAHLEDGAKELATMVKDGATTDELIATKLTILHDTFHSIMESWYKAGKEDGAEEHHDH